MEKFTLDHAKVLYMRFIAIYGDKFIKSYHDDDFKNIWCREWVSGLDSIDVNSIKNALEICKKSLEWPPTVAEFLALCEKESGMPSVDKALQAAIRGHFYHPVIELTYDKVGSWAMRNCPEKELVPKFKAAYQESICELRNRFTSPPKQIESDQEPQCAEPSLHIVNPAERKFRRTPEVARFYLDKMKKMLAS